MKKALIILTLLMASVSFSYSQTSLLVNNLSNCEVTFTVYLVDNSNCNITYITEVIPPVTPHTFPTPSPGFFYIAADINTFASGGSWAYEIETRCSQYLYNCTYGYPDFVTGPANCQPTLSAEWGACNQVRIF